MITNMQSGTRVDEIADGIYRISTPVTKVPRGFSYNQYLVVDDAPLLFHTGPRGMFALTREAIRAVLPLARLRYVGFSHYENDECGALNDLLAIAPSAVPLCGRINAMLVGNWPGDEKSSGEMRPLTDFMTPRLEDYGLALKHVKLTFAQRLD